MGPFAWFLFVYTLGGLTFIPFCLGLILLHAHLTLPERERQSGKPADDPAGLRRPGDDKAALKTATDTLAEQFHRKHEFDVAAGYFAVCREYVPGGVNGKPPDKISPAGETIAQESPSVYQSMYRSIFDRSQKPTIEPKDGAKIVKRANNVFYVVLRHGHLMLYDDIQQLEVRYVISLEYHTVDVFSGGNAIPEGELWMKRNAIRLSRKPNATHDQRNALPFFLFCENISEKEDFYFALLNNQARGQDDSPPEPQTFEVKDIVTLVQKLHSSEEHLQTRWLNAAIGRLFLAMYKTPELEAFIRKKLTKKISRVKKPNFITKLALQRIDLGTGAPFFTNPRLKDLTVNGDCTVEADMLYTGNFRIEVAATARIDLGTRFKPREVELLLAVTCKKVEGHVLVRFKPAPSNRLWYTFEKMPKLDLTIEPIVSSRQITYTLILKAIESRIREVVAETIVLPFWDDTPFLSTAQEKFRGGIWKRSSTTPTTTVIPDEVPEDEAEAASEGSKTPEMNKLKHDRGMSMPVFADAKETAKIASSQKPIASAAESAEISGAIEKSPRPEPPRVSRSTSYAFASGPQLTADHVDAPPGRSSGNLTPRHEDLSVVLRDVSSKSRTESPAESPSGTPPPASALATAMRGHGSTRSKDSVESKYSNRSRPQSTSSLVLDAAGQESMASSPTKSVADDEVPATEPAKKGFALTARSLTTADRKQALASINAATAAAQKWSMGVWNKKKSKDIPEPDITETTSTPMGRGRPLPPPGIPLPPPERPSTKLNFPMPRRKAVPPPLLPKRSDLASINVDPPRPSPSPKPPLPERRRRQNSKKERDPEEDEVLIVAAPAESAPASPNLEEQQDDFFGHGESVTAEVEAPSQRRQSEIVQRGHIATTPSNMSGLIAEDVDRRGESVGGGNDMERSLH